MRKDGKWLFIDGSKYHEFTPEITPLEAMLSMTHLNIREIDSRLQNERHLSRMKQASDLKAKLTLNSRCPKCTLVPPCKHFDNPHQFLTRHRASLFK